MIGIKETAILRSWIIVGLMRAGSIAQAAEPPAPSTAGMPPIPPARVAEAPTGAPARPTARIAQEDPPGTPQPEPLGERPRAAEGAMPVPAPRGATSENLLPQAPSILGKTIVPIDLNTTLRLAGVQNPEVLVAQSRVVEAVALRQLAAAQFLPSINAGGNYDTHTGPLQQSNGNILSVNRSALYVGAGANAIAAGTVNIPGVVLQGNLATAVYGYLISRQVVQQSQFANWAIRNQAFLRAVLAYSELLRAEGLRAVSMQVRDEARIVARLMAANAETGRGRPADANRAATQLARYEYDFQGSEGQVLVASARLAEVLNLDPSIRLHPTDAWVTPHPLVPEPMPVAELIALALLRRPEIGERRAAIRAALLNLAGAKVLPFSPNYLIGFSAGGFGGGSNLVRPVFGGFGGRTDFDAVFYWTAQNMGVGNVALINVARARMGIAEYEQVAVMDRIRAEVAEAYARIHARYAQIATAEQAVKTGLDGFREDLNRIEGGVGLPIELLNNLYLLALSRFEYLNAIVDYNEAQFQLYVALGQPPADALAHPVPTAGVVPRGQPIPTPPKLEGLTNPDTAAKPPSGSGQPAEAAVSRVSAGSMSSPPTASAGAAQPAPSRNGR